MIVKTSALSSAAVEVLGQLFTNGPTWDGNISSKSGCGELINLGLADRVNGFAFLTAEGVRVAAEWDIKILRAWHHQGWYNKAACR